MGNIVALLHCYCLRIGNRSVLLRLIGEGIKRGGGGDSVRHCLVGLNDVLSGALYKTTTMRSSSRGCLMRMKEVKSNKNGRAFHACDNVKSTSLGSSSFGSSCLCE